MKARGWHLHAEGLLCLVVEHVLEPAQAADCQVQGNLLHSAVHGYHVVLEQPEVVEEDGREVGHPLKVDSDGLLDLQ